MVRDCIMMRVSVKMIKNDFVVSVGLIMIRLRV